MSKILIVDDEPSITSLYKEVLSTWDYEVNLAKDGQQGYELVRDEQPDLVITDFTMPNLDGYQFAKKVRLEGLDKNTLFILISGGSIKNIEYFEESLNSGLFCEHLGKPIKLTNLTFTVVNSIENKDSLIAKREQRFFQRNNSLEGTINYYKNS